MSEVLVELVKHAAKTLERLVSHSVCARAVPHRPLPQRVFHWTSILPRGLPRAAVLVLAFVAASCGGGGEREYGRDRTMFCLRDAGAQTSFEDEDLDYIAQEAGRGALRARLADQEVTISFERSSSDAERTAAAYRTFLETGGATAADVLERRGNAVVVWEKTPSDAEQRAVDDCLEKARTGD